MSRLVPTKLWASFLVWTAVVGGCLAPRGIQPRGSEAVLDCGAVLGVTGLVAATAHLRAGDVDAFVQTEMYCGERLVAGCRDGLEDSESCRSVEPPASTGAYACRITTSEPAGADLVADFSCGHAREDDNVTTFVESSVAVEPGTQVRKWDCTPRKSISELSGEIHEAPKSQDRTGDPARSSIRFSMNWGCLSMHSPPTS